ncbi:MAG TPA: hypothetical protein ACFYD6_01490 [Candidatus Brocadiia bacterium]|nr:hypothetical protein [Candidatus Brocadiales bacterium]
MALNLRTIFSMEMTGIAMYNDKIPIQALHVTYSKPEPPTFDNVLKLESQSRESRVEGQNPGLQTPDSGLTTHSFMEQMRMYKEDRLLSSPGGDSVFVDANGKVANKGVEHTCLIKRVGKDIKDAKSNFVNMLKDASCSAKFSYITQDGKIEDGQRVGLVKTLENFFKDLFSGISLGTYTPRAEEKPSGADETVKHSLKKVFLDAVYKDVAVGIPRGAVQIVKDAALVCLNLAEAIPDATIGITKTGEGVTTKVFDNTQVALNFFTDILPGGEGRGRVYAFKLDKGIKGLPLIHNLTTPEQGTDEADFQHVRNTSFRKTIETISSIIPLSTTL